MGNLVQYEEEKFDNIGKVSGSAVIANIDLIDDQEFIFITESGWLMVIGEHGEIKGKFKLIVGGEATPLIADVDNDSFLELVIALNDQHLYCYDLQSKGPVYWGQFRANPYNTGFQNALLDEDSSIKSKVFKSKLFTQPTEVTGFSYNNWLSKQVNPYEISKGGIGEAQLGMTYGQFKEKIQEKDFQTKEVQLANGLRAIAIYFDEEIQYYLIFPFQVYL